MASVNYALPSWLQTSPEDTAKNFVSGLQIGATLGEARNRLQEQANQSAVENQLQQDKLTASAMQQTQELQVKKAYEDQQVSLATQKLDAAKQKIGLETMKAARQFQAQQSYQKDYQDALDSGLSEDEAAKGAMFKNLGMFSSGTGAASALRSARENQPQLPQFLKDPNSGASIAYNPKSGHMIRTDTGMPKANQPDYWTKFDASRLNKELGVLQKAQAEDTAGAVSKNETMRRAYSDRASRIAQINQQLQGLRTTGTPAAATGAHFVWNPATGKIEGQSAQAPTDETDQPEE